jgi:hypothetical protein
MKYLVEWTYKLIVTCVWAIGAWIALLLAFLMWDGSYIGRASDGFDGIWN